MNRQTMPETELHLLVTAESLLMRAGLAALLEERGFLAMAQTDGESLRRAAERLQPDVLVVDMGWHGQTMRAQLSQMTTDAPILALVANPQADETRRLLQTLAAFSHYGLLLRDTEPDAIAAALHAIDKGLLVIDPSLSQLLQRPIPPPLPPADALTARENEVLQWLAQGLTNKAIALELEVTEHTVKFHVNAIMSKLDAQSRTEAVVLAAQLGLIVL